jgi:hypothetical protein
MAFVYCAHYYKQDSPSSGLYRVKVYTEAGMPSQIGTGIFPREVMKRFPLLPLEEEGRLHDMHLRENFIDRVFAYYRWANLLEENPTPGALVGFHTAHKLTLMAQPISHNNTIVPLPGNIQIVKLFHGEITRLGQFSDASPPSTTL